MTNPTPESDSPNLVASKSKLLRFLSHPAVVIIGVIGAIASLIGIPLSAYFYYSAREYPRLIYYVHPVKATIVRAGEASRLSASFDNQLVQTDITAAQIAIWNEGKMSIKKDQILKPVVIFTGNNAPILEATIRKSSREITRLALNTDELQKGRVVVQWNILEQNDGGIVQLIYAGDTSVQIKAEGVIEGQAQISELAFSGRIQSPYEQYESERWGYRPFGYFLFGFGALFILGVLGLRRARTENRKGSDGLIKATESLFEARVSAIDSYQQAISKYEDLVASFEKQSNLSKELLGESQGEEHALTFDYQKHATSLKATIARYKEEMQGYQSKLEKMPFEKEVESTTFRREQLLLTIGIISLAISALLTLILGGYLIFFARPIGPPFGF